MKTHGRDGIALEKKSFRPLNLMNKRLMMLELAISINAIDELLLRIFPIPMTKLGNIFIIKIDRVKLSHRSDLLTYISITQELTSNVNIVART